MQETNINDKNRWVTDPPPEVAAIYDVDFAAVSGEYPWVRISRRICPRMGLYSGPAMLSLKGAMQWHPVSRASVKGIDKVHFLNGEQLPAWLQGRIAVLNMADPDQWIYGLGKRWGDELTTSVSPWQYQIDPHSRYYTIELNCRGHEYEY